MAERIRALMVDDQRLQREGFRQLLEVEPNLEVAGMARNPSR